MNRVRLLLFFLLALVAADSALASDRMVVSLVPENRSVLPGDTVTLAFVMRPEPGWHGYWRNPGDAGAEPRVQWRLPEGWQAGPLQYPVPDRLIVLGLMNYVFERDYVLLATLRVAGRRPSPASWCRSTPGSIISSAPTSSASRKARTSPSSFDVGAGGARDPAFDAYRQALPRPLAGQGRFALEGGRLRLAIPLPATVGVEDPYFFPLTLDALGHSAPQTRLAQRRPADRRDRARPRRRRRMNALEGVLEVGPGVGLALTARARRRAGGRRAGRRAGRGREPAARRRSCSPCSARSPAACCSTSCPASSRSSASRR